MAVASEGEPIAIIAGGGALPVIACKAAMKAGRSPIVIAISGEADPSAFPDAPAYPFRWGDISRLWKVLERHGCSEVVLIGSVSRRPDLKSIRLDLGAIPLLPRVARLIRQGDDTLLSGIAQIFSERGLKLVSILDVTPDLSLQRGVVTQVGPSGDVADDIRAGSEAAAMLGALDIGQAAVSVGGRVVALEGAEGTDGLLARLPGLREAGRIPRQGGVLVKLVKPQQDRRIDLPTLGPETARRAWEAKLAGVAASAGATLLAGRAETLQAFNARGLFLVGLPRP